MPKLKLQYYGYLMQRTDSFENTLMQKIPHDCLTLMDILNCLMDRSSSGKCMSLMDTNTFHDLYVLALE